MRNPANPVFGLTVVLLLAASIVFAQPKPKLRQVKIALPSQTIGATHISATAYTEFYANRARKSR